MPWAPVGKLFIALGAVLVLVGLLIVFAPRIPFPGHLPGDIVVERRNFTLYIPIVTCVLLSAILSLILWLLMRK